jgi:hypothetical protein
LRVRWLHDLHQLEPDLRRTNDVERAAPVRSPGSVTKSGGAAAGSEPFVLGGTLDETSSDCVATGVVTLGAAPSTADIAWSCAAP